MEQETQNESQSAGPSFDILELIVFGIGRFRYTIMLAALIGLGVGVFNALTLPNLYGSAGKFLVRLGKRESVTPEFLVGRQAMPQRGPPIDLVEELHLLSAGRLFEGVVEEVGAELILEPYDPERYDGPHTPVWTRWQHKLQAWWFNRKQPQNLAEIDYDSEGALVAAAVRVRQSLKLDLDSGGSRIISVKYRSLSPEQARDVVEAALVVCQRRHREVFAAQYDEGFVEDQLDAAEGESQEATDHFYEHRRDCGFYDIDTQRGTLWEDIHQLESKLDRAVVRMRTIEKEREILEAELAETPDTVTKAIPAQLQPNFIFSDLQSRLRNKRTELANVPVKFREGTPAYENEMNRLQTLITTYEEQLEATDPLIEVVPEHDASIPNPRWVKLTEELAARELESEGLLIAMEIQKQQSEELEKKLEALLACEPRHTEMRLRIASADGRARRLRGTKNEAEALALLDADESFSNLQIIQPAMFNPLKVGPERGKLVLMGLGGGLGAGLVLALLRQLLDSKIRFPRSIEKSLGLRVLCVVPEQPRWRRMGRRLRRGVAVSN